MADAHAQLSRRIRLSALQPSTKKKKCDVAKCEWGVGSRSDPTLWHTVRGGATPRDWEAMWGVERPIGTAPVSTADDGVAIAFDTVCL